MGKTNIKSFGKTYNYLKYPDLRAKETGDAQLVIKDALFSGADFQYLTWKNIRFVNCDFAGAYEIKLTAMKNCAFESCKIVGIHNFGEMTDVRFIRCLSGGESIWGGDEGSTAVVFEECQLLGESPDRNHQGGIGTRGEAIFLNCKIKRFSVIGFTKLVMKGCECEDVTTWQDGDIRNSKLPRVDASWLETQHLQLQGNEIGSLDLSNSRIGQLEVSGNTISRGVDFSHTQARQANVQRLRSDQAKLEGSNIKLAR